MRYTSRKAVSRALSERISGGSLSGASIFGSLFIGFVWWITSQRRETKSPPPLAGGGLLRSRCSEFYEVSPPPRATAQAKPWRCIEQMLASVGFVAVATMEFIKDTGFSAVSVRRQAADFSAVCAGCVVPGAEGGGGSRNGGFPTTDRRARAQRQLLRADRPSASPRRRRALRCTVCFGSVVGKPPFLASRRTERPRPSRAVLLSTTFVCACRRCCATKFSLPQSTFAPRCAEKSWLEVALRQFRIVACMEISPSRSALYSCRH